MSLRLQCLSFLGLIERFAALWRPKAFSETHRGADLAFLLAFASFFFIAELLFELIVFFHLIISFSTPEAYITLAVVFVFLDVLKYLLQVTVCDFLEGSTLS